MEKPKSVHWRFPCAGSECNNFGWRIDADGTAAVVTAAIDAGINFFDTADIYGGGKAKNSWAVR